MNAISGALDVKVLAMGLSDVRATIDTTSQKAVTSPQQSAEVILDLSTAAQNLMQS